MEKFVMPSGWKAFESIPIKDPLTFQNKLDIQLSIISGILQDHRWLETLDTYVVAEPVPPQIADVYVVKTDSNLKKQIQKLRKELEEQISTANEKDSDFSYILNSYTNRLKELSETINSNADESKSCQEHIIKLTNRISDLEIEIEKSLKLQEQISELEDFRQASISQIKNQKEKISQFQKSLNDVLNYIKTLININVTAEDFTNPQKLKNFTELIKAQLQQELVKELSRVQDLEIDIKTLQQELENKKILYHNTITKMEAQYKQEQEQFKNKHQADIDEYQNQYKQQKELIESQYKTKIAELQTALNDERNNLIQSQLKIQTLEQENGRIVELLKAEQEKLNEVNNWVEETNNQLALQQKEVNKNIQNKKILIKQSAIQIAQLTEERRTLKQALSDAENKNAELKNAEKNLNQQLLRLKREMNSYSKAAEQQKIDILRNKILELETENLNLTHDKITGSNKMLNALYSGLKTLTANQIADSLIKAQTNVDELVSLIKRKQESSNNGVKRLRLE